MTTNMMHLSVEIKGGVQIPIEIDIRSYYVTPRTIKFKNGVEVTEIVITKWIKKYLEAKLKELQELTETNFFD